MRESGSRKGEMTRVGVDANYGDACTRREVEGELTLTAPDVENPLARADAFHEEVVVAREPMLHVHTIVVLDGRPVERVIDVVVGQQQLANGTTAIRMGSKRR